MNLTSSDETDLLTALYGGAFDEPLWATFLARLRVRVQADYAGLLFRGRNRLGAEVMTSYSGRAPAEDIKRRDLGEFYPLDPIPYQRLRPDRVYSLDEFLDIADLDHLRFQKEILDPTKLRHLRVMRILEPSGTDAWCIIGRELRDFPASAGALLSALAPHLNIALRSLVAFQRERLRATISADVAHRLNFGWLTLDAAGHVIDMDDHAAQLLQHSAVLRRTRHGRLLPTRPEADRMLSQILRTIPEQGGIRPRLIHLWDDPWFDMLVVPVNADPSQQARPVMTVYIQGDEQPGSERCGHLMTLFKLSRKEAQLALALGQGRTIVEAAGEIGLTIESARTYSKRVYAKTFTRGQSDLIRLILAGVIALA